MTDLLKDVVRGGTAAKAHMAFPERNDLAGKTGTTNEGHDTWFVGFNADVVAAAWVGFDQDRSLGGREQGGFTAHSDVDRLHARSARERCRSIRSPRPLGIVEYRINPTSGLIANDATRDTVFEKFEIDNVPAPRAGPTLRLSPIGDAHDHDARGRSTYSIDDRGDTRPKSDRCPAVNAAAARRPRMEREAARARSARLMAESGIDDFGLAKRKAAERLGIRGAGALPKNAEIQACLARAAADVRAR